MTYMVSWDFVRSKHVLEVCKICEESIKSNQIYENMNFYQTANAKNQY